MENESLKTGVQNNLASMLDTLTKAMTEISPTVLKSIVESQIKEKDSEDIEAAKAARRASRTWTVAPEVSSGQRKTACVKSARPIPLTKTAKRMPVVMTKGVKSKKKAEKSEERQEHTKFGMYRGPIDIGSMNPSDQILVVNMDNETSVSSSGVGVIATELTFNPNTTTQWAEYDGLWREYRVLAVRVEWVPNNFTAISTTLGSPIAIGMNKGSTIGTPTSRLQVLRLAHPRYHSVWEKWAYVIRPDDYTDLDVGGTASPSSEFSLLIYGDGQNNTITYGRIWIRYVIQLSSRQ